MSSPPIPRPLLPVVAAASASAGAVFTTLVALDSIAPWPAVAGAGTMILLTCLVARPYLLDLSQLAGYIRRMEQADAVPPPHPRTGLAEDIVVGLGHFRRAWQTQGAELQSVVAFHQRLFDALPSPLFLVDTHRRIVLTNLAARNIVGGQHRGRDLATVLRHPDILDATDRVLAGAAGLQVDVSIVGPLQRDYRAQIEPLDHLGSDGARAVLWFHDVTTLKRMEQMRADFVANASHELRTPLAALLGFIETLRGPARDDAEARDRFLAIMAEQAGRMSRLVQDLLNLSRIELHEHTPPAGRADIGLILKRVTAGLELHAGERKMRIDLDLPESLPPVTGAEDELAQIFQNLIDNALKYGRDGTPVEVTARLTNDLPPQLADQRGPAIAVAVRDHGEGIAREHLPRLTERFFRVDTARSRRLGGTGLGLAIVKHVINRHRGVLAIDSTVGEGSTFTVYLPTSDAP